MVISKKKIYAYLFILLILMFSEILFFLVFKTHAVETKDFLKSKGLIIENPNILTNLVEYLILLFNHKIAFF